ncbi:hypothetical protein ES332_A11G314400v1 [Gossypium tomentosum]|uniref:Uncharacterized protein n=1 Tax=Gossypium tomentosum TaxID=34277 RepID=A0A5D2NG78_GOSTO|nr:hypothetical protein ES332_A11G314400v1 [Gossypium tomentosum]
MNKSLTQKLSHLFISLFVLSTQLSPKLSHFTPLTKKKKKMEFQNPINKSSSSLASQLQITPNGQTLGPHDEPQVFHEDYDSTCSTPYVSAPSSPGRAPGPGPGSINGYGGFYYSAPASPMHFAMTSVSSSMVASTQPSSPDNNPVPLGFEFEFSARYGSSSGSGQTGSMSSADELFLNGKIRPMKLCTHLERPQVLAPLLDLEHEHEDEDNEVVDGKVRGRDLWLRDKSLRRRTRSMSPLRTATLGLNIDDQSMCLDQRLDKKADTADSNETSASMSASSSRSSSAGRSSKRWVFLKDFLRSKSEGRSNNHKFWSTISFSTAKEKKPGRKEKLSNNVSNGGSENQRSNKNNNNKPMNGISKRRVPPSPHELHYTANRAQAEEMRKKTFLPYRQGLLGCLGFSSKGYGAMNGLCKALNPVSSR